MNERLRSYEVEGDLTHLLNQLGAVRDVADGASERLRALAEAIIRWNDSINLVSRKDIARLVSYHFCDSASVIPLVRRWNGAEVLDVGGSNGLPGLVLAALMPDVRVLVCDSKKRRLPFLEEVCGLDGRELPIVPNAGFEIARIDAEEFQAKYRGFFDVVVARAVTRMRLLAAWCMPLLKETGGRLVAYKGSRSIEEVNQAESSIFEHGGRMAAIVTSPWHQFCNPLRLFVITERGQN